MNGKSSTSSQEWGNRGGQQNSQAHEQTNQSEGQEKGGLNSEGIERLRGLLGSLEKPSGACSLALSGKSPFPFGLHVSIKCWANYWVIDSGATDHMTHTSQYFNSHTPCPSSRKIIVANGSLATDAGLGDIYVTPLILKNVLHVPKLSTNLVSIQKLTEDLKCHAIFHPSYCVFQDRGSGRKIGLAKERNGLYYLETSGSSNKVINNLSLSFLSSSNRDVIWLHHFRLGHPSFRVLNIKFPFLFKGLDMIEFHCHICELAKHKRVSFPTSN